MLLFAVAAVMTVFEISCLCNVHELNVLYHLLVLAAENKNNK